MHLSSDLMTREAFACWVSDALNHLYDSSTLQRHPLATALGLVSDAIHSGPSLRRALLQAIRSLRPTPETPARSFDWRAYRILDLRYIEGLDPGEVMDRVALGRSQYFHEQARALDVLVSALWANYQAQCAKAAPQMLDDPGTQQDLLRSEVERLSVQAGDELQPSELLGELGAVVEPLSRAQGVPITVRFPRQMPVIRADRVLLRQAVLQAITQMLDLPGVKRIDIQGRHESTVLEVRVTARLLPGDVAEIAGSSHLPLLPEGLSICQQLVAALGGTVEIRQTLHCCEARMVLHAAKMLSLLVIDDNQRFVQLFRRYLAESAWHVSGAADGQEARRMIAEAPPTIILLDVLMPTEDGWDLLMALKQDEATRTIPIVVCSVLDQRSVALALGADAYLRKPVAQQVLVEFLAQWS